MKYITVREYEKNLILEDLARTKQALDNAYDHFENVVDPDLIDCYIYEVNAVQQKAADHSKNPRILKPRRIFPSPATVWNSSSVSTPLSSVLFSSEMEKPLSPLKHSPG